MGVSKKKNTQKNDSGFERKGFVEMVKDITDDAKEKLGIETHVTKMINLDAEEDYWYVRPSVDDESVIVESGGLKLVVESKRGAKALMVALNYSIELLAKMDD